MTRPSNSPKRRRRWPRVLSVFLTVVLALGAWGGWHAWRTSLPVSHAHNDPMTVQMHSMFRDYGALQKAIRANDDKDIRYRKLDPDMGNYTSYVDVTMDGKTMEIISNVGYSIDGGDAYSVGFYPATSNPGTDECSSSLWLGDKAAGYFEDCSSGKDERFSLGMSRTQQEQLARKACWKLIDTAVAHW